MRTKHETIITHCATWGFPMKRILFFVPLVLLLCLNVAGAGTFVSGSTGADGAFNPTTNTELQIPPSGIFNFTTVNIPSGVTVTFKKNAANTPVYILATGDVTIAGTIKVSGGSVSSTTGTSPGAGGPGGYDGGYGGVAGLSGGAAGKGLGPGGGGGGPSSAYKFGGGGGFGTAGGSCGATYGAGGPAYGNSRLIPLIGGSGGGGYAGTSGYLGYGGGGGGGAILVASSGTITSSGAIYADGGNGYNSQASGGSGGAIKLIANTISGTGYISAQAGSSGPCGSGTGRIRLETFNLKFSFTTYPVYTYGLPGNVFVANTPTLSIISIGGVNVPSNPTASYANPDIALPNTTTNPITVGLAASNIPVGTTVTVSAMPQYSSATNVTTTLTGSDASSTATASVSLSTDYASVIMAYTTFTLQSAMFFDGEKIDKVRIASAPGQKSQTVYITESGKEIEAETLVLAGLIQ